MIFRNTVVIISGDDVSGPPRRVRLRGGPQPLPCESARRSRSRCWAGSINQILCASGGAGSSYRFTDLFFSVGTFCRVRSVVLAYPGGEVRRIEKLPLQQLTRPRLTAASRSRVKS